MNYGSALTSFAMNRTLKNLGKTVIMLEHRGMVPGKEDYGLDFAKHFYDCSKITNTKDFKRFNSVCDTFLVGSDQVWNWWNIQSPKQAYILRLDRYIQFSNDSTFLESPHPTLKIPCSRIPCSWYGQMKIPKLAHFPESK